ncbi:MULTISPECIES: FtsW/RodA/SpoVE family cell cycle protein [unclassified Campylobacter]|uniref:FtsW/RodA/SpoVE family cell cycle protein n=1 Tax=unclassified Campylobacter TaxID=2593542 RepID=UPI0012383BF7|nr:MULTISPECIES: FtsW/RodA/SpoVE family cell cycle protein [unclassified Campylobacter]KAA6224706.1 rod shape-determining protein RodA [Campylobacter sp. LR185c]KAA6225704.1 rod shape-determining protein RodA [Campylobacter sp. LR286c]KAA6225824.1 rod shape-determining protein RodA [Campylobacter sp. LR196d]KAA6229677.1 rod shape-determining protein RodA [Campylobacter sp. LR291e]KAA6230077.1 rod shape-determining protein RodA [Campylobacter sp. LR264d]
MIVLDRRILTHFDYMQPILVLPIVAISFFLTYEASVNLVEKQFIYTCVGFFFFTFFFFFPIRKLMWLIPLFYWVGILLLLSVDIFGVEKLGAARWLQIPFTTYTIQPSEFFKPAFVLMLAYLIYNNPPPDNGYKLKQFIKLSFYIILPFLLIAKEPDLGTAMVLIIVGFGTLFIIGINYKIWLSIVLVLSITSPVMYTYLLKPYQKQRIHDFIAEKPSYQVTQAMIAIGNGGLLGKSQSEATQTHFKFLPIHTSDFIFAYMVERFGFVGGCVLIVLYIFLILHLLSLNHKLRKDHFGRVVLNAVALFIFIYTAVNISMVIGFAPVVGIPLPFFSHGGSSFTTFMVFFGLLQHLITFRFSWYEKY